MALAITPTVSGSTRNWLRDVALYAAGAAVAAILTLAVSTLAFALVADLSSTQVALDTAVTVVAIAALHDLGLPIPMPYRQRQVPSGWRTSVPNTAAMASIYGFALGLGFVTLYTSSLHLALIALAPASASSPTVVAAALAYAVGKATPILVAVGTETHDQVLERVIRARTTGVSRLVRHLVTAGLSLGLVIVALERVH
jgi:hypothetical protein